MASYREFLEIDIYGSESRGGRKANETNYVTPGFAI